MSDWQVFFTPLLPLPMLLGLAGIACVLLGVSVWRRLPGWIMRALAIALLVLALLGPAVQEETREPLPDILLVLVDNSASQSLPGRSTQSLAALAQIEVAAAQTGLELVIRELSDGPDGRGSLMAPELDKALADIPKAQLAGVLAISDGVIHDADTLGSRDLPAPFSVLMTGARAEWDRRLTVLEAPRYAVTGEESHVQLRVDALGRSPEAAGELLISVDGASPTRHRVAVGRNLSLPITLTHAGETVVHLSLVPLAGELTERNNQAALRINGIRDRLRVLLVSGEPHPGTRTWRNLLKSDASVDLVHFTILRPPHKQDGVPVNELSLIPFPTQDLFITKVNEFDLIIFDRYRLRGILPAAYLESVRDYVEAGGAVLVAAGPEFAGVESLSRSPLGDVLPARPLGRVLEGEIRPELTEIGQRHPVTQALEHEANGENWGPWLRHLDLEVERGQVVMQSADGRAVLALDRVGDGRVALIGSDQIWLWARGYGGGGPQLELLRRLAHWMMGEPELEEEALVTRQENGHVIISRQTLSETPGPLWVETPGGQTYELPMDPIGPGQFEAKLPEPVGDAAKGAAPALGVYRVLQDGLSVVAVKGEATPKEFIDPLASEALLMPMAAKTGGGVWPLEDGFPRLRAVRAGQNAIGRGWVGYTPRAAYVSRDLRVRPVLPAWLLLLLATGLMVAAWLYEGRRSRPIGVSVEG